MTHQVQTDVAAAAGAAQSGPNVRRKYAVNYTPFSADPTSSMTVNPLQHSAAEREGVADRLCTKTMKVHK